MSITLSEFFEALDGQMRQIPLEELIGLLAELTIDVAEVHEFAHFSNDEYQRNLMRTGPAYEALLLCWTNGQRSPIHDHRGSSCGVIVIKGTATETIFDFNEQGWIVANGTRDLQEGSVCGSFDMDTHQISNLQPGGGELITMHVYSPPLAEMGVYSLTDNTVKRIRSPVHWASSAARLGGGPLV